MSDDAIRDARILVVDDRQDNLELISRLLRHDGYRNLRELNRADAIVPEFADFGPDIVLLDLHMPDVDGFAVLERLSRRIPRHHYLPIVVLTADVSLEARRRALALGAKDFITKPFDLVELLIRVRIQLETRRMFQALRRSAENDGGDASPPE
jgi:DNA-binding response OmpR family regulator